MSSDEVTGSVEMFAEGGVAVTNQPSLSCGGIQGAAAIAADESDSAAGQVLLLGGSVENEDVVSTVYLVDLATGVCTQLPHLLQARVLFAVVRLPDGRIVCAGGFDTDGTELSSVEVFEPPAQGAFDTAWTWRQLPAMSMARAGCRECVLSDGRFAVLGGEDNDEPLLSCEALTVGDDEHWEMLPPMHEARSHFACAAVAGCIVVAGGTDMDVAIRLGAVSASDQLKSSTRRSTGGYSFHVICRLTPVRLAWAARCSKRPRMLRLHILAMQSYRTLPRVCWMCQLDALSYRRT
jgi:hypothetical protein